MKILPERDPPGLAATSLDAPSLASKANDSFVVLQNNYANGKRLAPRFVRASTHFEGMTTLDGGHREISISDHVALQAAARSHLERAIEFKALFRGDGGHNAKLCHRGEAVV